MKKIIITISDNVDENVALRLVTDVVQGGKVSENKNGKHYCWITTWESGYVVATRQRKKGQNKNFNSFNVYKQ